MEKFGLKVQVDFRAAHRLMDYVGNCNSCHGEFYIVTFCIEGYKLQSNGLLIDFKDVKRKIKKWVKMYLDHATILRKDDPLVGVIKQRSKRVFVMEDNPTAESIAKLFWYKFSGAFKGCWVQRVEVQESTPDNIAYYENTIIIKEV